MHSFIEHRLGDIAGVCRKHQVRRLEVFGSAARGSDFDPASSDADFLVEFAADASNRLEGYFNLKSALEELLQRRVDLIEAAAVRNPYLQAGISQARETVYAHSQSGRTDLK